jgi:class 3 adenylate cyclase/tetratricopeptide (TPR) repeat protein
LLNSREDQISKLREAIAAQEALRATLGDETVELTLKPLRSLLESLLSEQAGADKNDAGPRDELLAQLQSYIPRQLADKIRATGHIQGERRQVTVVFADVSGFTALSETLDPEEVVSFMNECLKELAEAVYQYEGMVDSIIGDCVMAVFGAPIAMEDDAERALRAALSMRDRLEPFNRRWTDKLKEPLALHIGINSGTVIAGSMGDDLRMRYAVVGDTVNVASRLEGAATRGQIFVSQSTHRLTAGAFRFRPLEPIQVKGKRDLLKVYELLEARVQPEKIRGLEGLVSPLVGRERESGAITAALAATKAGKSAIVLVYGDAGVGKSRLLREIRASHADEMTWLEGRCFSSTQTQSYGPILDLLRRHIGIADEQHTDEQQQVLRQHATAYFPNEPEVYAILARLLALPLGEADEDLIKEIVGAEFSIRLFDIIELELIGLSAHKPVVVLLEDLHWADQSSIDLLNSVLPLTRKARLTFVCAIRSRQEPAAIWEKINPVLESLREHVVEVSLQPLSSEGSRTLIAQLLGGFCLPESLAADIVDKSDGNPFFLEEVLRSLIEGGALASEDGSWRVASLAMASAVPDTIQGVLLSRIDRLTEELRVLLQKASVIGRVFFYRVLKVLAAEGAPIDGQLTSLQDSDLLHERARLPEIEYAFKHALTQEVAYHTLLGPQRKALHHKVGEALESLFRDRLEEFAGLIAYHFFSAESWDKALPHLLQCSNAASQLCLFPEVRGHGRRALECLRHLEDTRERREQKVDVIFQLIDASLTSEAPDKNLRILAEAEAAAQSLQDPLRLARVQLLTGRAHYGGGNLREAIDYFQRVLALAPGLGDPRLLATPGCVLGVTFAVQGRFRESIRLLDQTIPLLEAAKDNHELLLAHSYRGCALTCLGRFADGLADMNKALEAACLANDRNGMAMAHCALAFSRLVAGEYAEGMESSRRLLEISEKTGADVFRYGSNAMLAWGAFRLDRPDDARHYWNAAREIAQALGGRIFFAEWFGAIEAEFVLRYDDPVAGLRRAEEALVLSRGADSVIGEGLAECTIGKALAADAGRADEAFAHVLKGIGILEGIGAQYDLARAVFAEAEVRAACGDRPGATVAAEKAAGLLHECNLAQEEATARRFITELKAH